MLALVSSFLVWWCIWGTLAVDQPFNSLDLISNSAFLLLHDSLLISKGHLLLLYQNDIRRPTALLLFSSTVCWIMYCYWHWKFYKAIPSERLENHPLSRNTFIIFRVIQPQYWIPPDSLPRLDACEPAVNASGIAVHAASLLSSSRLDAEVDASPGCRYNRNTTMECASQGTFLNWAWGELRKDSLKRDTYLACAEWKGEL